MWNHCAAPLPSVVVCREVESVYYFVFIQNQFTLYLGFLL